MPPLPDRTPEEHDLLSAYETVRQDFADRAAGTLAVLDERILALRNAALRDQRVQAGRRCLETMTPEARVERARKAAAARVERNGSKPRTNEHDARAKSPTSHARAAVPAAPEPDEPEDPDDLEPLDALVDRMMGRRS